MALGTRIVVMMFAISVVLYFAQAYIPMASPTGDYAGYMDALGYGVDGEGLATTDEDKASMNLDPNAEQQTGIIAGIIQFFTTFPAVVGVFNFLFSIFFAPVNVLKNLQAPAFLVIAVGGIWVMMYIIAITSWIWRKDF